MPSHMVRCSYLYCFDNKGCQKPEEEKQEIENHGVKIQKRLEEIKSKI